jgi:2-iminoacetate synthase ThiH
MPPQKTTDSFSNLSELSSTGIAERWVQKSELTDIYDKVMADRRLSREDGLRLFKSRDLLAIGFLANVVRERLHSQRTYWVYNQHINYSNVCVNGCTFCAFSRRQGEEGGFVLTIDQVLKKVRERLNEPIREIHVVGGSSLKFCRPLKRREFKLCPVVVPRCSAVGFGSFFVRKN